MKFILLFASLFSIFFCTSLKASSKEKTFKLATIEWPPYTSGKLKGKGWASEVVKASFKSQGYKARVAIISGKGSWGKVLKNVKSGRFLGGFPAYYSEDRTQHYFFSRAFGSGPLVFFKRKGDAIPFNGDLETLKSYKIGIVKDYYNGEAFRRADYLQKRTFKSDRVSLVMLSKKRVDLVLLDKLVTEYHLKNDPYLKKLKQGLQVVNPPLQKKDLHIVFSKKHPNGAKFTLIFNRGLNAIRESGELKKILEKNQAN